MAGRGDSPTVRSDEREWWGERRAVTVTSCGNGSERVSGRDREVTEPLTHSLLEMTVLLLGCSLDTVTAMAGMETLGSATHDRRSRLLESERDVRSGVSERNLVVLEEGAGW